MVAALALVLVSALGAATAPAASADSPPTTVTVSGLLLDSKGDPMVGYDIDFEDSSGNVLASTSIPAVYFPPPTGAYSVSVPVTATQVVVSNPDAKIVNYLRVDATGLHLTKATTLNLTVPVVTITVAVSSADGSTGQGFTFGVAQGDASPVPVAPLFPGAATTVGQQLTLPSDALGVTEAHPATMVVLKESSEPLVMGVNGTDYWHEQPGRTAFVPDADKEVDVVLQPWPKVVPSTTTVTPSSSGTVEADLPVTLSAPSTETVTASWQTLPVPGAAPTTDYQPGTGTVTFAPGQTAATVPVTVTRNSTGSPENVVVSFSSPGDAVMGGFWGLGIVTIAPMPVVLPGVGQVVAPTSGTAELDVPVQLSGPSSQTVTASWHTLVVAGQPGFTQAPTSDYVAVGGTVTFAPGQTSATVPITVSGDSLGVGEYVVVSFSNATNASVGGVWGLGAGLIQASS